MSWFRRAPKEATAAREALRRTSFPPRYLDVREVVVDYDAARWVRLPVVGEDRESWAATTLAAFVADWQLDPAGPEAGRVASALAQVADDPLEHTAMFLNLTRDGLVPTVAHVDVAIEEVAVLEHGTPEVYLTFTDVDPESRIRSESFTGGVRHAAWVGPDEQGQPTVIVRAHKALGGDPPLHVHVMSIGGDGSVGGEVPALALHTDVVRDQPVVP